MDRDINVSNKFEIIRKAKNIYPLIIGTVVCIFVIFFTVNIVFKDSEFVGWILFITVGYLLIINIIKLLLIILICPQRIVIQENILTIDYLFRTRKTLNVLDIDNVSYSVIISIFVISASGWLKVKGQKWKKYYIAKPLFDNFDNFIDLIAEKNKLCKIDYRIKDWEGSKPLYY